MRVAIREQLCALVVFAILVALMILSIPTWVYVHGFTSDVQSNQLALTASLKSSRISSELELVQTSAITISSRLLLQQSLLDFYAGNTSESNWYIAKRDIESALNVSLLTGLLQARIYSRNITGNPNGLVNVTGTDIGTIRMPYDGPDGNPIFMGDSANGYPPELYPNITYHDLQRNSTRLTSEIAWAAEAFPGVRIAANGGLLLGPLAINDTFALMSISTPIRSRQLDDFVLGYITIVFSADTLLTIRDSREGMGSTGVLLLVGSTNRSNRFGTDNPVSNNTYEPEREKFRDTQVRFLLAPLPLPGQANRHSRRTIDGRDDIPFAVSSYPAVFDSLTRRINTVNNASADLSTHNEQNVPVAVGFARTNTPLVNWTVVVEQAKSETDAPISTLRNIILGCVFGTAGLAILLIFPCAHLSVQPIRRLKYATEKTVAPPGYEDGAFDDYDDETPGSGAISARSQRSKRDGMVAAFYKMIGYKPKEASPSEHDRESARRTFKIPSKVEDRKHFITDELTELTETFNEMSEELVKQYTSLDAKVAERTRELEISKKAAEAANESKTLFIANISHELKTPLNGILGMCAICMEETDVGRIKQSLKTLYKSGDLLLHLLEDLLSFSKNQIGQQLSLEEREFRLAEIRTQVLSIFDKQVREGHISLSVDFLNSDALEAATGGSERPSLDTQLPALGPHGTGRLKDMCLWGDQHRILQVIINLVSNSVKFTPAGGKVHVRIKCIGEVETPTENESRTSSFSRDSKRLGRSRHRLTSSSIHSGSSKGASTTSKVDFKGTALAINPAEPKVTPHIHVRERSPTPPPPGARAYMFEFEVEDTGPGIAENMQQRVFEPFVQGDLGLSKKFGGTGLGLSICHQLATLMGGSISLTSTVGVGTTFTMRIPLKYVRDRASSTASSSVKSRPPSVDALDGHADNSQRLPLVATKSSSSETASGSNATGPQTTRLVGLRQPFFPADPTPQAPRNTKGTLAAINKAMANKSGSGKLRVLVADDNSTNIEVVSKMLKLEDVYDVTIAKDGQEAYDLVKANMAVNLPFDVIFMDIQMPNLDGLQSTKLIRKMGYTAPIVALTAFSEESNVKECMDSGMDEFLSKPIRRPALKQVLKKFATIPEEPETASLTRKTTPEDGARADPGDPEKPMSGYVNGSNGEVKPPNDPEKANGSAL